MECNHQDTYFDGDEGTERCKSCGSYRTKGTAKWKQSCRHHSSLPRKVER